jgi:hypothetical protein
MKIELTEDEIAICLVALRWWSTVSSAIVAAKISGQTRVDLPPRCPVAKACRCNDGYETILQEFFETFPEGAGDHDEVVIEDAHQFEKRIVAGHDLPRLDAGDVPLGDPEMASQFPLAPAALLPRISQRPAQFIGQSK